MMIGGMQASVKAELEGLFAKLNWPDGMQTACPLVRPQVGDELDQHRVNASSYREILTTLITRIPTESDLLQGLGG